MEQLAIGEDLRKLLASYAEPCVGDCDHSQCPLLRELHALRIKAALERARVTVESVVNREKKGEEVGDLMNMRLRVSAPIVAPVVDGNDVNAGVWFQSAVSGGWYRTRESAGDLSAIRVDGVRYVPSPNALCVCGHIRKAHESFEDHDECMGCIKERDGLTEEHCSWFQVAPASTVAPQQSDDDSEPDIYDLVAQYRDRMIVEPFCVHCELPIALEGSGWVHLGSGLITCRRTAKHDGIFNAEPAPASPAAIRDEADDLVDEVQHRMDQVVEAAVEWHEAGQEGGEWFEAAEKLGAAINSLLELRGDLHNMPRRWCSVHNCEEFKYESLEHELRSARPRHVGSSRHLDAATTPPSTLARKAAEEIDALLVPLQEYPKTPGINEIAAIIERCFSAESEIKSK